MKISKKLLTTSMGSSGVFADDTVSASAGVASAYYWRGLQVSDGPQVWADVKASAAGLYGGVWASSEGFGLGPEYDIYAGYSNKVGDLGFDVGVVNYVYSSSNDSPDDGGFQSNDPGEFADAYIGLTFMGAALKYYRNISEAPGDTYLNLGYTISSFTFTYGTQTFSGVVNGEKEPSYQHFDVTYAYNENLSLTVGTVFDADDEIKGEFGRSDGSTKIDTTHSKVIVAYTIPLK